MIRIFLSTWTLENNEIHNPVVDFLDTQPDVGAVCNMYYPDADANGIPDGSFVMVVMRSTTADISALATTIGGQAGVKLIPPRALDRVLSSLTTAQKNAIKNVLSQFGIDPTLVNTSSTVKDLLKMILSILSPGHALPYEAMPAEFG